jgi:hypothetical protein
MGLFEMDLKAKGFFHYSSSCTTYDRDTASAHSLW